MASPSNSLSSAHSNSQPRCLSCQSFMSKSDPHSNCCVCDPDRNCTWEKRCLLCQDLTDKEFKAMLASWNKKSKRKHSAESSKSHSKKLKETPKDADFQSILMQMFNSFREDINSDMANLEKRVTKTSDSAIIRLRKDLFFKQAITPEPDTARTECVPSEGLGPEGSRIGVGS